MYMRARARTHMYMRAYLYKDTTGRKVR